MSTLDFLRFQAPVYFYLMSGIAGAIIGSFLGVVIERVPPMILNNHTGAETLIYPPSHCTHCKQCLRWWHNIPLISWVLLRGKCAYCKAPIPYGVLLTEGLSSLFFVVAVWFIPDAKQWVALWLLWGMLVPLMIIDWRHLLLPDCLTLPLLWAGLLYNDLNGLIPLSDALWGAVAGYTSLWAVYWSYRGITGKEGLGYGDFKLLAALGAWVGWQVLPMLVLSAAIIGIIMFVIYFFRRTPMTTLPFGPCLSLSGLSIFILHTLVKLI